MCQALLYVLHDHFILVSQEPYEMSSIVPVL